MKELIMGFGGALIAMLLCITVMFFVVMFTLAIIKLGGWLGEKLKILE